MIIIAPPESATDRPTNRNYSIHFKNTVTDLPSALRFQNDKNKRFDKRQLLKFRQEHEHENYLFKLQNPFYIRYLRKRGLFLVNRETCSVVKCFYSI